MQSILFENDSFDIKYLAKVKSEMNPGVSYDAVFPSRHEAETRANSHNELISIRINPAKKLTDEYKNDAKLQIQAASVFTQVNDWINELRGNGRKPTKTANQQNRVPNDTEIKAKIREVAMSVLENAYAAQDQVKPPSPTRRP